MKKLKLTVDALRVETFQVDEGDAAARGTVLANESDSTCVQRKCGCGGQTEWDLTCATCRVDQDTCYAGCPTYRNCPTGPDYPGC